MTERKRGVSLSRELFFRHWLMVGTPYKLVLFEILVEVSLLSPWRSPCRRSTRVIISTPLIPVHVTFAHRVTTCTGSTDKERRLSTAARPLPEQAGGGTGGGRNGTETSIIWVPGSLIALG